MATDVIIIGGGVIGLLSALRLKQAGLSVEVFEKGEPATESSWAALGVLSPEAARDRPSAYVHLAQVSLALYPALAAELLAASDIDVDFRRNGLLNLALTAADAAELKETAELQARDGVPAVWLSTADARALEPSLNPTIQGALHLTDSAQVDNRLLCKALIVALGRAGVPIRSQQAVTGIVSDGGRLRGIRTTEGESVSRFVVIAAGAWSGGISTVTPVRPMRGQAALLDASAMPPLNIRHIIDSHYGYVVPRAHGRYLIGATVEDKGFDTLADPAVTVKQVADAAQMVPALSAARVHETWAGLRPRSADDQPVLGPVAGCAGLIAATGHFRNGILLAPISAQLVTDWISGRQPSLDVARFSPNRFAASVTR